MISLPRNEHLVHVIVLTLLSFTLWIDAATGAFQYFLGVNLKLSLLYKIPLIAVMLAVLISHNAPKAVAILVLIMSLIIGPVTYFSQSPKVSFLINDISMAIKVVTPFIVFYYCRVVAQTSAELFGQYYERIIWINAAAIMANLLAGAAGFGYPSYAGPDGEQGIGVNGFYVAGNELSGCFVLLFGFVLFKMWNKNKKYFFIAAAVTLLSGVLIATKTAMLASVLMVFGVPIINERGNLFKLTKLKLKILMPILILGLSLIIFIAEFLQAIGLYEKFVWFLQEKGILGLLLSGRLEFSQQILDAFFLIPSMFKFLFGIGTIGMSDFFSSKYAAEVDPIDLFVYFGFVGSVLTYAFLVSMIYPSFKNYYQDNQYAPIVVLINIILLFLSLFSGHILNSGMLGLLWGMFNSLVFVKANRHE